ncbi:MAG: outer membrane beta-barrel protein [Bacteroides sp.]|nr:outer membrane beta-barrel protein [Bacteroides sp.]
MKTIRFLIASLSLLLLLLMPLHLCAQVTYAVSGSVQSATGEPLAGANVRLTHPNRSTELYGMATDKEGRYSLRLPQGEYALEISYVGYASHFSTVQVNAPIHLPAITLSEESQQTDAVVVTARTVTYSPNGYVAEVAKNPFYREQDLNTVLKLLPGTTTAHNQIKVYGKTVSKIYLNGRELQLGGEQLISYLETIEGKNVKQMEVIAASGVEEDASAMGTSIIKITTRNPETGGMLNVGDVSILYGEGGRYSHAPNVNLNLRLSRKWGFYANGMATFLSLPKGSMSNTHLFDSDTRLQHDQEGKYKLNGSYRGLMGLSYDLDERNMFSIEASYINRRSKLRTTDEVQEFSPENGWMNSSEGIQTGKNRHWQTNFSFNYLHRFNKDHELSFRADRFHKKNKQVDENYYDYTDEDERDHMNTDKNREDNMVYTLRLDYTGRFRERNSTFTAGVKYTNLASDIFSRYKFQEISHDFELYPTDAPLLNTDRSYQYNCEEEVYAAYAKYVFRIKQVDVTAGLRVEHALLSPAGELPTDYETTHTDLAPELGLHYALNREKGHNLSLQYTRSISRPNLYDLNPYVKQVNEYSYLKGNLLLEPATIDRYALRSVWFNSYSLVFSHTYSKGVPMLYSEETDGVIYTSPVNGMKWAAYSIYAGIPVTLGKWGRLNFSADYSYTKYDHLGQTSDNSAWNLSCNALFRLPGEFNVTAEVDHSTPIRTMYGETRRNVSANFQVSKSLFNRSLNLFVRFSDLFNSNGGLRSSYVYDTYSNDTASRFNTFHFSIGGRYTLRWGQKSNVRRGGSGNQDEMGRFTTE